MSDPQHGTLRDFIIGTLIFGVVVLFVVWVVSVTWPTGSDYAPPTNEIIIEN